MAGKTTALFPPFSPLSQEQTTTALAAWFAGNRRSEGLHANGIIVPAGESALAIAEGLLTRLAALEARVAELEGREE